MKSKAQYCEDCGDACHYANEHSSRRRRFCSCSMPRITIIVYLNYIPVRALITAVSRSIGRWSGDIRKRKLGQKVI